MPGGIQVDVSLHWLDDASERVQDAAAIGVLRGGEHLKGAAQERTPKDTGDLQDSEEVRPEDRFDVAVYVPGPYARFQEFGPHFNPEVMHHEEGESPYLSTTLTEEGEHVIEIIADAIRAEGIFQ